MSRREGPPQGFEIPDLELPPPRPSQSGMRAVIAPKPQPTATSPLDVAQDFGHEAAGSEFALELEAPISMGHMPAAFGGGDSRFDGGGLELTDSLALDQAPHAAPLKVAPQGRANWPTGVTPPRESLTLDPIEIRSLADFGDAPSLALLTPVYALRVTLRKRALLRELAQVDAALTEAELRRDATLARLTRELRPGLAQEARFQQLFSGLTEVESLERERGSVLLSTRSEQAQEEQRLEGERGSLSEELTSAERALDAAFVALSEREQLLARAEARYKRCFIEIRALSQAPTPPADATTRIAVLEQQAQLLRTEFDAASTAVAACQAECRTADASAQAARRRLGQTSRATTQVSGRFKKPLQEREALARDAGDRRNAAFADVGRKLLAENGGVEIPAELLRELHATDEAVLEQLKRSELCLRALDAGDEARVRAGIYVLSGLIAASLAVIAYQSLS